MVRFWQRLRAAHKRSKARSERWKDEIPAESFLLQHEYGEREKSEATTPIPPMRNNTDWSGWGL